MLPSDETIQISLNEEGVINVRERLSLQHQWCIEHAQEEKLLYEQLRALNPQERKNRARMRRIIQKIEINEWKKVAQPLEFSSSMLRQMGYKKYKEALMRQYATLTKDELILWLDNLKFILTPDFRALLTKLTAVREYRSFGQRRHFVIGGPSGMGKTTFLEWYVYINGQSVDDDGFNYVPVILLQAPVTQKSPLPLLRRIIRGFGLTFDKGLDEDGLSELALIYVYYCSCDVILIDEIGHIRTPELKRRLIEFSNDAKRAVLVGTSVKPALWLRGDEELEGRMDDQHTLKPYKGKRLRQLLSLMKLILPFASPRSETENYYIDLTDKDVMAFIQTWSQGILREITVLIYDTAKIAIQNGQAGITFEQLKKSAERIRSESAKKKLKRKLDERQKTDENEDQE